MTDIALVMRRISVRQSKALYVVREKIKPNKGFYDQVLVWKGCGYALFEVVDSIKNEKGPFSYGRPTGINWRKQKCVHCLRSIALRTEVRDVGEIIVRDSQNLIVNSPHLGHLSTVSMSGQ